MSNVHAQLQQAMDLHRMGHLAQAQTLYDAVLKAQPRNFDALHLSGRLAAQANDYPNALKLINKAIKVNPDYAEAYYNRGIILQELKDWNAALASYDRAIALKPGYAPAYSNRSVVLQEMQRWDEAFASAEAAIAFKPDHAEAWYNRGMILQKRQQWEAALASHDRAIAFKPDYAEAFSNLGAILQELKIWDAAIASHDRAIALKPDYAQGHHNRGVTLQKLKKWETALASYDRAIALKPDYADAFYSRGIVLQELKQADGALASYAQAIALKPGYAQAYSARGVVLQELGRMDAALASCDRAIALKPDYPEVYSNRGNILSDIGRLDEAIASHDQAIALKPDCTEAHYNKSFALLLSGNWAQGWQEYEWRWKTDAFLSPRRNFSEPPWLGKESLAGKTILLHWEQALGDTIQFCRYVPMVAALGSKVILLVQPPLVNLLAGLGGVTQLVGEGSALPAFDYHCPLLSLPLAFATNPDNIPASEKYLKADAAKLKQWQTTLGSRTKPRVGLVWRGSKVHTNDRNRSIVLSDLIRQLPDGFQYVSLQKEINAQDQQILEANPQILHLGGALKDFTDTAALCELMDMVISIDTSVAHLSAALGKQTWVLLPLIPDWRWLMRREDSPWYPSARLYRQEKTAEWISVFERVSKDLRRVLP